MSKLVKSAKRFGPRAAAKAERACDLTERIIAIELITAAEGLEIHRPLRSGDGVERALAAVRSIVDHRDGDRSPGPDIEALADAIAGGLLDQTA